ncbi:hypothetical protein BDZ97DRAFT_1649682 [Flammula alnicola]|nr:hypothetical protein BDZ97DRAFT_1649682 [Flammula alnicola]
MSSEVKSPLKPTKPLPKRNPGPFSWVKPAFRSKRTIKTWIRCCVAFAATMVLMVATKTSNTMGQAAFFSVIIAVMIPPSLALSLFLLVAVTLLLGMLVGWAWGSAAMASALSVRSSALLAQQEQKLQSLLDPNLPANLQIQGAIFHGFFLDPRSSAVYGAFLFVGSFAMGAVRTYLPNLVLFSIFGTIVLDVICTTGPYLPTSDYMLSKLFIIPTCFYIAVAIGSLVLIFPQSLNHVWLTSLEENFWTPILDLLRLQSEALASAPSVHEAWAEKTTRGNELRSNLVNALDAIAHQIKLIHIDTSIGRLGPTDLKRINAELKSIMFRAAGLYSFQTFVNDTNMAEDKDLDEVEQRHRPGTETPGKANRYQALIRKIKEREMRHGHDLDSLVPILASSSANLRASTESALVCVIDWFQECNSRRFAGLFKRTDKAQLKERQENLVGQLRQLEDALEEFRAVERVKLIKPYERFFDPETRKLLKTSDMFASRSLYICFVLIDTLDAFAERIAKLLKIVIDIDAQRPNVKLWFPGRIATVKDDITGDEFKDSAAPLEMGSTNDPAAFDSSRDDAESTLGGDKDQDEEEQLTEPPSMYSSLLGFHSHFMIEKRNPDAFPPTTAFGRVFLKLAAVFRFFKSPQGIFCLRMGVVSVALWIPSVCHSTAWFYYDNKGVWALIMAQTGLAIYAGDQIANFVVRLAGTLIGLVIGMGVWYIAAGLGHGNPYGLTVATTVFLAPFLFARIAGPPRQLPLWIMTAVTIVFVIGYSWINANMFVIANTGVGVNIGWKRALLVIIGFTAAFIVMLFPNPISSRVLVRKTLAAIVGEAGNIFTGEIEAFLAEEARARRGDFEKTPLASSAEDDEKMSPKERRMRKIAKRIISVSTRLRFISPSLTTAKFEPQLSGTWPHTEYQELFILQQRMTAALGLLVTSFAKLDPKWCSALVHRTPYLNPNFLSDVFVTLTTLSNALMEGHSLPAYLPKLRDRLVYHEYHSGGRSLNPSLLKTFAPRYGGHEKQRNLHTDSSSEEEKVVKRGEDEDKEITAAAGPVNVDGSSMGFEDDQLTLDLLLDEQLPAHSTAVVALSSIISRIDEMIDIVRKLCGEATFRGYESLQRDYLDREERAVGSRF